jgi:hypothetical protein
VCEFTTKVEPANPGAWSLGELGVRTGRKKRQADEDCLEKRSTGRPGGKLSRV